MTTPIPIKILTQNFYKELSAAPVNWLLGNVGDKIRIETSFVVQNEVISSSTSSNTINNTDGYIGGGWVTNDDAPWANFQVGDQVYWFNYIANLPVGSGSGIFTIVDKLSNGELQLYPAPSTPNDTVDSQSVMTNMTPITSVKYHYNFIENGAASNFLSPFDGSEQLITCQNKVGTDGTTTAMFFTGSKNWQSGSSTIQGIQAGIVAGRYTTTYKIIHYTKITPFILDAQRANQLSGLPYKDFKATKCWKFITLIEAAEIYTNPNFLVSEVFENVIGNTGWYNENFNTGLTNYSISGVTYKNNFAATPSIHLDATETEINFIVQNTIDTPFASSTQFVIGFHKIPADPSEYQLPTSSGFLDQLFCFDRALQQVGIAPVNGDNYGTPYQVLKSISATLTDSGHIAVTVKIDMGASVIASFAASSNPMYLLYFATQKHGLATNDPYNDSVTLQVDANIFTIQSSDPGMIVPSNVFIRHPEANPLTEGVTPGAIILPYVDPIPVVWTMVGPAGTTPYVIEADDLIGGTWVIGATVFTIDMNTTMAALVNSINNNTPNGFYGFGFPAFNNTFGFTASWNIGTQKLTINAPLNSGASYNGKYVHYSAGTSGTAEAPDQLWSDGHNGTRATFDVFPEDEIVACSSFYIESNTRLSNVIKLTSLKAQIVASNATNTFKLGEFIMPLDGQPMMGYTQQFDIQVPLQYHVPANSIRKFIEVKRDTTLDTGTRKYFTSKFPFIFRWETWVSIVGADPSFYNPALPNNGFNEWWYQYASGAFQIYYLLTIGATKDGVPQQYTLQQPIIPHDYRSNAAFTTTEPLTFDPAVLADAGGGAVQLVTGAGSPQTINGQVFQKTGTHFIYGYKPTLVAAIFTKTTAPASACVVIGIEVYNQGGIAGKRRYSSKWQADSDTWFASVDPVGTPNMVKISAFGNSIIAQCLIDNTKLPPGITSYKLTARIYEIGGVLETDDSVPIETDGGVQITID